MARVEARLMLACQARKRGERRGRRRGAGGPRLGGGGRSRREGCRGAWPLFVRACYAWLFSVCERRQQGGRRKERKKEKEGKGKKKKKKYGKFSKLENFCKIKDNL
jgi:hypothetical protein